MKKIVLVALFIAVLISCEQSIGSIDTIAKKTGYSITLENYSGGIVTKNPEKSEYRRNEKVSISVEEESGYSFYGWEEIVETSETTQAITEKPLYSSEKIITLVMDKDYILHPVFANIPTYTLTLDSPSGGTIVCEPDKSVFYENEEVSLRAVPNAAFQFIRWEGDLTETTSSITMAMDKDYVIQAIFESIPQPNTYRIADLDISGNGRVEIEPEKDQYVENETITFKALPGLDSIPVSLSCTSQEYVVSGGKNEISLQITSDLTISAEFIKRNWTFIVYMAADNDLEASAVQDFNELEAVNYEGEPVSVLVLLDRSPSYDATNENWNGTRLYEIQTDPNGVDGIMRSKELTCEDLDLSPENSTNVDTGSSDVLKKLIQYSKEKFTAEKYGLIMWGHGTGWRGSTSYSVATDRAFAIDETAQSYMSNAELGKALSGQNISILGFDTCFGGIIETAYEIKDEAQMMVASEGSVPAGGWDYNALFSSFLQTSGNINDFCTQAITQFKNQYSSEQTCTISSIDLTKIENVKTAFDVFSKKAALQITNVSVRKNMLNTIMNDVLTFSHTSYPCDLYVDMYSLSKKLSTLYPSMNTNALNLQTALEQSVTDSWSSFLTDGWNCGVYFCTLESQGVLASMHNLSYVQGSGVFNQSKFVLEGDGWVPHKKPSSSLLDKLFYVAY